jgi:hypothetical protein
MLSVVERLSSALYAAVGIGLIAAISLGRLMQESLFEVKPMDAPTSWPSRPR